VNYKKSELVALASCLQAMQAAQSVKPPHVIVETAGSPYLSSGAYEADE